MDAGKDKTGSERGQDVRARVSGGKYPVTGRAHVEALHTGITLPILPV